MKAPAKKAAAHHHKQQHKRAKKAPAKKAAVVKKKAAASHRAHQKHLHHPTSGKGKGGRAKAAPGSVLSHGYTPDDIDVRDHVYAAAPARATFVDLPGMPPVWHQGDSDSCVRYAVLALYVYAGGQGWPALADEMQVREAVRVCAEACGAEYLSVLDLQACLSGGFPVAFGITLPESFDSSAVIDPAPDEPALGPHCLVAVGIGYGAEWRDQFPDADSGVRYVKLRNSWGADVHRDGYLLMPADYLLRHGADFWMMRSAL